MRFVSNRTFISVIGLLPTLIIAPAWADDTEIFNVSSATASSPNILFVLDTSGSMGSGVTKVEDYDPSKTYSGKCETDSIYYSTSSTPSCFSPKFDKSYLKCAAASTALFGSGANSGKYSAHGAIRWVATTQTNTVTSSTATTTQNFTVTYTITTTSIQQWTKSGNNWSKSGAPTVVSVVKSPETSVAGKINKDSVDNPTTTSSSTTYVWSTTFNPTAPSTTITTSTSTSPATSDTVTGATSKTNTSTSNDPAPKKSTPGPSYDQTITVIETYKRVDTKTTNTGDTTTTTTSKYSVNPTDVECDGDQADPGTPGLGYPNNVNPTSSTEFTKTKAESYWDTNGGVQQYNFYSGNYINYRANPPGTYQGTRLEVVQQAASDLIDKLAGVNVGLMRYSNNGNWGDGVASGGMVTFAMAPVDTNKTAIKTVLNNYTPAGNTPLSETLYEAYLYYSGGKVYFGKNSKLSSSKSFPSVPESRDPSDSTKYLSPITGACQTNYVVYLTDGEPTTDTEADSLIKGLPSFAALGGGCEDTSKAPYSPGWGSHGACLAGLSQYMYNSDMGSPTGTQKVASYFIGFGSDFNSDGTLSAAFDYLTRAATRGGGIAYQASDLEGLESTLEKIVTDINVRNTSFVAPTVAVDAFNRTETLSDLFFSVFQPSLTQHWPGNVKKYRFANGEIEDANGHPAVDTVSGFFNHSAQSIWSSVIDGENVVLGGAAHKIPDPPARNIYTFIGGNPGSPVDLTGGSNYSVSSSNALLTPAILKIGGPSDPSVSTLLDWARGVNVKGDKDPDGVTVSPVRHVMGDPVHSRPAAVIYGGTEADPDLVLYAVTNDGYLHAIGGRDGDGAELWAFIPQDFLGDLITLYNDAPTSTKHYSLDGDVIVLKYDVNNDGIVDPSAGDRVIIYFGQGRGGSKYYAMDVTDKNHPKYMWTIGPSELPGIGQAWSTPEIMRINVKGATQNTQKLALFIGGGYDPSEDSAGYFNSDSVGNHLYIVDATSGALLWSDAKLALSQAGHSMDHAIPSEVNVIDLDGDGYADRMYVGDQAGQLWRFDIFNGEDVSGLVTGGVIASLGTHDESPHDPKNQRRFYYPPSVALVERARVPTFFNVAIGSGYRGHPLNTTVQDRFYSVRDFLPFTKMSQTDYNKYVPVTDADLVDVTDLTNKPTSTSPGWKLLLNVAGGGWDGEKVLSRARTRDNIIFFQTYTPSTSSVSSTNGCTSSTIGSNLSYQVNIVDGAPIPPDGSDDSDGSGSGGSGGSDGGDPTLTAQSRYTQLKQSGIAPEVIFLYGKGADGKAGLINAEKINVPTGNGISKTYWREAGAE